MSRSRSALCARTLATFLALVVAGVGGAARAADTSTTFTLTASGGLAVSAPGTANLGSAATDSGTISAQLGTVTVTDSRGLLAATWTASVVSTAFTTGAAGADETIAAGNVEYWSGTATATTGTVVAVPGQATSLLKAAIASPTTAFSATGIVGNNSVAWNPTLVITVPADSVIGTYSGTVTHSVA